MGIIQARLEEAGAGRNLLIHRTGAGGFCAIGIADALDVSAFRCLDGVNAVLGSGSLRPGVSQCLVPGAGEGKEGESSPPPQ